MNSEFSQNKDFIEKLKGIILANLDRESFGGKDISRETGWNILYINRRLKKISGKTLRLFIREIRLKKAMELLNDGSLTAAEVAYRLGFCSPAYFNTCFSEYHGFSPGEIRKRLLHGYPEHDPRETPCQIVTDLKNKQEHIRVKSDKSPFLKILPWMVAGILVLTILMGFKDSLFHSVIFRKKPPASDVQKYIAVLPFRNGSEDSNEAALMNGMMEAIYDNLCRIKSLSVISRSSAEKYRNPNNKSISRIAKELGVKYVVEGNCQQIVGRLMLSVHLIDAEADRQLFSRQYQIGGEDIFAVMSELAMDVAAKTDAAIKPGEVELIKKPATTSLDALITFQRGLEIHTRALCERNPDLDKEAINFYLRALRIDPGYPDCLAELGSMAVSMGNRDSAMIYANLALRSDSTNARALALKGDLLKREGQIRKSEKLYNLAVMYNPSYSPVYRALEITHSRYYGDNVEATRYLLKTFRLENIPIQQYNNLLELCVILSCLGMYDEGRSAAEKLMVFSNDSTFSDWFRICRNLDAPAGISGDESWARLTGKFPGHNYELYRSVLANLYARNYEKAYRQLKFLSGKKGIIRFSHNGSSSYLGLICLKNGHAGEADLYFKDAIEVGEQMIRQNDDPRIVAKAYFDLATAYSALGKKEMAIRNLKAGMSLPEIPVPLDGPVNLHHNPVYDPIRNEPLFLEYVKKVETRVRKERNLVQKMLKADRIIL